MALIRYHVPIPHLEGMTEEQRIRALTDYMRESNRQMELVITQLNKEIEALHNTQPAEESDNG